MWLYFKLKFIYLLENVAQTKWPSRVIYMNAEEQTYLSLKIKLIKNNKIYEMDFWKYVILGSCFTLDTQK